MKNYQIKLFAKQLTGAQAQTWHEISGGTRLLETILKK